MTARPARVPGKRPRPRRAPPKRKKLPLKRKLLIAALSGVAVVVALVGALLIAAANWYSCAICGEPIGLGKFYVESDYGDVYHTTHRDSEYVRCDYCGRICTEYSTAGPPVMKLDGHAVCQFCHRTAIIDWDDARKLAAATRKQMAAYGLTFDGDGPPISLVDEITLKRLHEQENDDMEIDGLTTDDDVNGRDEVQIYVLSALPKAACRWVLAHELMHAWVFHHVRHELALPLGEGAAELLAYNLLHADKDPVEQVQVRMAIANPDKVYGAGLRNALAYQKHHGFPAFVRFLQTHKNFSR